MQADGIVTDADHERVAWARDMVASQVEARVAALPHGAKLPAEDWRAIYRALAPLGYLGSTIPASLGGAGLSYVAYGLLLEELARGPILLGEIVPPRTINYLGTTEQKARWLPALFAGDLVSAAAITEPQAGSDLRNLRCTARTVPGGYRVSGQKKWIKLGGLADLITLMVTLDDGVATSGGKPRTSRLVLERDVSPWTARELDSVGIERVSYAELTFDDVFVPADNLLGAAGEGAAQFNRGIEASRAFVGLQAAGLAAAALDSAVAYCKERTAFGRPLARFQAIQSSLADAASKLAAARALCLSALAQLDRGRAPDTVAMAKLFATETAVEVCHAAMDAMGAHGLSREAGIERRWRDARMLTVIDGTSGIQRLIIGRALFGTSAFV